MTANFLGEASVRDQQRLQDRAYFSLHLADSLRLAGLSEPPPARCTRWVRSEIVPLPLRRHFFH